MNKFHIEIVHEIKKPKKYKNGSVKACSRKR